MSKSQKFKDNFLHRVKHMQFCLMRICFFSFGNKSKHKKMKKNEGHNNFIGKSKTEEKMKKNVFFYFTNDLVIFQEFFNSCPNVANGFIFFSSPRNICEI